MDPHPHLAASASVGGGLGGGLQGPPGHFQGSLHALVPADESSGVDEDAALDPAELGQGFVANAAPLFQQGQPVTGRWRDGKWSAAHFQLTHD